MPNAPSGGARTLRTHKGIEFPAAFYKSSRGLAMLKPLLLGIFT
ncbi:MULTISPECIES: hypothetical protein [unclassified Calothrix]|nr:MULTISPECIES: hypothetical protein [unclassified Calothrix]